MPSLALEAFVAERLFRILSLMSLGIGLAIGFASIDEETTPEKIVSSAEQTFADIRSVNDADDMNSLKAVKYLEGRETSGDVSHEGMYSGSLFAVTKK